MLSGRTNLAKKIPELLGTSKESENLTGKLLLGWPIIVVFIGTTVLCNLGLGIDFDFDFTKLPMFKWHYANTAKILEFNPLPFCIGTIIALLGVVCWLPLIPDNTISVPPEEWIPEPTEEDRPEPLYNSSETAGTAIIAIENPLSVITQSVENTLSLHLKKKDDEWLSISVYWPLSTHVLRESASYAKTHASKFNLTDLKIAGAYKSLDSSLEYSERICKEGWLGIRSLLNRTSFLTEGDRVAIISRFILVSIPRQSRGL